MVTVMVVASHMDGGSVACKDVVVGGNSSGGDGDTGVDSGRDSGADVGDVVL